MMFRNVLASRQGIRLCATPIATAVALALMSIASAHAQTTETPADKPAEQSADKPADTTQGEKVVVTGFRYSIDKSLDQKRDANAIVDVVTAEDVGKFPDKNVADALQRVPGVIIDRDGGEGKNVSVRGLSSELTLTELNGNYIATAESNGDPTRSFNYMLMPSNMLSSAELFKTPEARIDEGGIGGTVILHTRRPLDVKSGSGFVDAEGTWADTTKKTDPQYSGQYSWHDKDNRFGVLVGFTQQKRTTRTMGASTENWQWYGDDYNAHPATDVNGNPSNFNSYWWGQSGFHDQNGNYYTNFMMPTSVDMSVTTEERERKGGQLTLQFKPVRNLTFTGNYFRFDLSQNSQTNTLKIPEWNLARYDGDGNWPGGRMLDGLSFDPSHTIVTGAQYSAHPGKTYYCSSAAAAAGGLANSGGFGPDDCTIPTPQITGSYNIEKALSQTADLEAE
ncbi:MAG TPA: TonB-dependent receptor, partial [Telluria sp.]